MNSSRSKSSKMLASKLAKMPDSEISRLLRQSRQFHTHRRVGKPKPGGWQRWSATEEHLLGRLPDAKLAKRLGRSLSSVQRRRWLLGLRHRLSRPWTDAEDRLLAQSESFPEKVGTRALAKRLGRSFSAVRRRRWRLGISHRIFRPWTDAEDRLLAQSKSSPEKLGTRALAKRLGRSFIAVQYRG